MVVVMVMPAIRHVDGVQSRRSDRTILSSDDVLQEAA
jgi:hypothetical protein